MDELLPLLLMGAVVSLIFGLQRWQQRRAIAAWREAALGLGLNLQHTGGFDDPVMYGVIGEIPVHATIEWRGSGRNRTRYTVVKADVGRRLPRGFSLRTEGLGAGLMKVLGEQDIELGDPRLDAALMVQGDRPAEMRALLRAPRVRDAVLRCFAHGSGTTIADDEVCVVVRGLRADDVGTLVRDAVDTARALAAAADGPLGPGAAPLPATPGLSGPAPLVAEPPGDRVVPVPDLGPHGVASLARIVAAPGSTVGVGALLCEIFTAKGTVAVAAPCAGVVAAVHARPGDSLRSGAALVRLWAASPLEPEALPLEPEPEALPPEPEALPLEPEPEALPLAPEPEARPPEPEALPLEPEPLPPEPEARPPEPELLPPEPEPRPPEPPAGLPPAVCLTLEALAAGRVPLSRRDAAVAAHAGEVLRFTLLVDDVRWTSGLFLPDPLRGGRTASGTVATPQPGPEPGAASLPGPALAVRFGAHRNDELDAARGGSVTVVGRLAEWDDLYRRALVDDDG